MIEGRVKGWNKGVHVRIQGPEYHHFIDFHFWIVEPAVAVAIERLVDLQFETVSPTIIVEIGG